MEMTLFNYNAGRNYIILLEPIQIKEIKANNQKNIFYKNYLLTKIFKLMD